MSFRTPARKTNNKTAASCRKVPKTDSRLVTFIVTCCGDLPKSVLLAFGTVISGPAALDDAPDHCSTSHARFAFAFIDTPEALRCLEVAAVSVGEIDPESRACVDCFLQ